MLAWGKDPARLFKRSLYFDKCDVQQINVKVPWECRRPSILLWSCMAPSIAVSLYKHPFVTLIKYCKESGSDPHSSFLMSRVSLNISSFHRRTQSRNDKWERKLIQYETKKDKCLLNTLQVNSAFKIACPIHRLPPTPLPHGDGRRHLMSSEK